MIFLFNEYERNHSIDLISFNGSIEIDYEMIELMDQLDKLIKETNCKSIECLKDDDTLLHEIFYVPYSSSMNKVYRMKSGKYMKVHDDYEFPTEYSTINEDEHFAEVLSRYIVDPSLLSDSSTNRLIRCLGLR
jgi:hypothetical protein